MEKFSNQMKQEILNVSPSDVYFEKQILTTLRFFERLPYWLVPVTETVKTPTLVKE